MTLKRLLHALTAVTLLLLPNTNYGQAPTLGTAANFVLFTGVGAVTNGATPIYLTHLTGNLGSNSGAATGFGNVDGVLYSGDLTTGAATADLTTANVQLNTVIATNFPVSSNLGGGDTLTPGVYEYAGAATLNGTLYLNALGDPNAVFIFRFSGVNTFDPAANSKVRLINGAQAGNVYWKVGGAFGAIAAGTNVAFKGTIVANGAINLYSGDTLEGRALSTIGAISVQGTGGILGYLPIKIGDAPLTGPAAPALGATKSYALFSTSGAVTNAGLSHILGDVGGITAAPTGFGTAVVNGTIHFNDSSTTAAANSLLLVYNYLNGLAYDIELMRPDMFGHNLVLTPHTYLLNAATTLIDTVILNAQGNPDAIFVFQVVGAFDPQSVSVVKLINGAKAKNVYWVVTGASTVASNSIFNGNIIGGTTASAIDLGTGVSFAGRAMTNLGAVTINGGVTILADVLPVAGPITGDSTVCVGSSITLTGVDTGGVWSRSNTHATVNANGVVTGVTAGIDTIKYKVVNAFGADSATRFITIMALPVAGPITGPSSVCIDSAITIVGVDTGGVFSRSNANATISSIGLVTGVIAGTDTMTYTVTTVCGISAATKVVTINAVPNAGSITGASSVCPGGTTTLTDTATGGLWSATNSRATVSSGGVVTGVSNGTDTIRYIVNGACGRDTAIKIITINSGTSAGVIVGLSNVCTGSSITLTDAAPGGIWSASNVNATVVGGVVTGAFTGVDTISYTVTNTCGTAIATKTVTVNPAPNAGSIVGLSTVCTGSSITLTDAAPGGVWSASNTTATVVGGVVTGAFTGVDTISYTVTNTCGTAIATKTVTVNLTPNAGSIIGLSTVCTGSLITLTDAAPGGIWSASNTKATVVGGVVTGAFAGVDTISYTVTNTCGTAIANKTVTVNPAPNAGSIVGLSTVCTGSSITLTDAAPGGIWSASNTTATVVAGVVTGAFTGVDTINYTVTNTCGTAIATKTVTVNPAPNAGSIVGLSTVCTGSSITLTDAAPGGIWSASNTTATVVGGVVTGAFTGVDTISYTVTNTCGTAIATKTVTVNPAPNAGSIVGLSTVCTGSSITLTDAAPGGIWSASNTTATVVGGVVTGAFTGVDTISYTVTNTCGSAIATKTLTVSPAPNAGSIVGLSTVCTGSSITLTDAAPGGIWSASNTTATVVGGVVTGAFTGVDTISYTVTNTCGTAIATKTVTVNPAPNAGSIVGLSTVCTGSSITLTDAAPGGIWSASNVNATVVGGVVTGAFTGFDTISYTVTNTCGTAIATKTVTVNLTPNAGSIVGLSSVCTGSSITLTDAAPGGVWSASNTNATVVGGVVTGALAGVDTISYTVTNTCGTAIATKTVTVNPAPNAGSIVGLSTVCTGSSITLTDAAPGGIWSASNTTATVVGGVVTGAFTGVDTISYTVTNTCGTAIATKTLTVSPAPNAGSIVGLSTVCTGSSITLTDAAPGGIWSASNATATVAGGLVTGGFAGIDTISYAVTNTCGTAIATKTATVNPLPNAGAITGASSVCVGSSITLADAISGGLWIISNANATLTGTVVTGATIGIDTIMYIVNNVCGADSARHQVTINPLPNAGSINGASSVCVGSSITLTDAASGGLWSASNTTATVVGGLVTGGFAGIDTISYAITNICGTATATKAVTINPLPNAGVITGATSVCVGSSITLADAISGGLWIISNANATLTGTVVTGATAGIDTIMYIVNNVCGADTARHQVTINPLPNAGSINGASSVCVGSSITLTDAASGGLWSASNATATVVGGLVTGGFAGIDTISYAVTNICGTATATKAVTINPLPNAGVITGASSICIGADITLSNAISGGLWIISNANATLTGTVVTGATAGNDTVRYIVNNICGSDTATKIVTVQPTPVLITTTTPLAICDSSMFSYVPASSVPATAFAWLRPVTAGIANLRDSGTGSVNEALYNVTSSDRSVVYQYTLTANGCSNTQGVTVIVYPTPKLARLTDTACNGAPFTFVPSALTAGTTFTWTRNVTAGVTGGIPFGTNFITDTLVTTMPSPVNVVYVYTMSYHSCTFVQDVNVTLFSSIPVPVVATRAPVNVCSGTMYQNFGAATMPPSNITYNWTAINAEVWAQGAAKKNALISFHNAGVASVTLNSNITGTNCVSNNTVTVNVSSAVSDLPTVTYFNHHFVCTPSNEGTYQWGYDDKLTLDSTILTGEINQDYLNTNPDVTHNYYWAMTTFGGCSQKTYYKVPNAVQELSSDAASLSVYPNPVTNLLNVEISSLVHGMIHVEVLNMLGQITNTNEGPDNKATIDVSSLSAGAYIVVCYKDGIKIAAARFTKN